MTRNLRRAPGAVVLLALALPLSACGGAPTDASKSDFCAAVTDRSWADDLGAAPDGDAIVDGLEGWGDDLAETGTPDDIPDEAREGFDITVDYLGDLDPADFDDLDDVDPAADLTSDEEEKVEAFNEYVAATCVPDTSIDVPEPATT